MTAVARYLEADMDGCERQLIAHWEIVAFSARCPGKEGPNEDGAMVLETREEEAVLAIADGMGGGAAGEVAARLALEQLERGIEAEDASSLRERVLDAFDRANRDVLGMARGAATTLLVATLGADGLRCYHVGDSGALLCGQRGRRRLCTIAHSPTGYAVEAGLIEPDAALLHEERHLVSNMVGDDGMRIDISSPQEVARYDTLVLASDGLFDNLTLDEITEHIRRGPLEACGARLVQACRQRMLGQEGQEGQQPSKPDDLSVLLARRSGR